MGEKKEENLIKTASGFCIVHDPRGGQARVVIGIPCL